MAPSVGRENSGVCSLLTDEVKDTTDRDLIISHVWKHEGNMGEKFLKMKQFR
jgi:hypothetical protein